MTTTPHVICIGAATLDLIAVIDGPLGDNDRAIASQAVLGFGGPAATAAVALARLGVPVAFVGTIGDDEAGELIRRSLVEENVDVAGLRTLPGQSAMSPIWVNQSTGDRSIAAYYGNVGSPALRSEDIERCVVADWIHVDHAGFVALSSLRAAGVRTRVSIDAGTPIPALDLSEVALYSPTAQQLLERYPAHDVEAAMVAALDEGPSIVAVTMGAEGSVACFRQTVGSTEVVRSQPFVVDVVSSLGAGDVFHGALIAALTRGLDVRSALTFANAAAAMSCAALDGRTAIPRWGVVEQFLISHGTRIHPRTGPIPT